jgi:D-galactosaminyltransferase
VTAFVRAGAGLALVLVVPGVLLLLALRARLTVVEWLALIPACSLAVISVLAELLGMVGAPFGPVAFFIILALLGVIDCVHVGRDGLRNRAGVGSSVEAKKKVVWRSSRPFALIPVGLVLLAILVTSATLLSGMKGHATTPPFHDGAAHGFIIARVAATESAKPRDVLVSDGSGRHQATGYYPLALHESLAIAHRATGAEIGYLLEAAILFFAAIVFPLSLYALTRFLTPESPLAAAFAALLGSLFSLFPYDPVGWSAIPLIAGMALVPVTVVLLVRTVTTRWSRRAAVLSGLVVVADFTLHNSQLPLILGLVSALVVAAAIRARSTHLLIAAVARLTWIGVIAVVLLLSTLSLVAQGASERTNPNLVGGGGDELGSFLGRLLTLEVYGPGRQGWLTLLAVVGIAILLRRRQRWEWIVMAIAVAALTTGAAISDNPLNVLTFPWYQQAQRVAYNLAFFVPVFGGVALALIVRWVAQRLGSGAWAIATVTAAILLTAYPVTAAHALHTNRELVHNAYMRSSPVQADSVAAFEFIRRRSHGKDAVLNDVNVDGSLWMYAIAGIRPVFGLEPHNPPYLNQSWSDRLYLVTHISGLGHDPKVKRLIRRLHVRFVYFGDATFSDMPHNMTLTTLRSTPELSEVYSVGGAHVFEIATPRLNALPLAT